MLFQLSPARIKDIKAARFVVPPWYSVVGEAILAEIKRAASLAFLSCPTFRIVVVISPNSTKTADAVLLREESIALALYAGIAERPLLFHC